LPQVELIPASPGQQPVLANLLELYAHDFSEFHPIELGVDGRFGYKHLPLYWSEPDRHPFLLKADGKLAGFAFVKRGSQLSDRQDVWDMAEFFVVRAYRRQGIGITVAREVWKRFPGPWEVRVMESNRDALTFWQHAIASADATPNHSVRIEKDNQSWHIFSFESKPTL
jgi:predicted acetyltransferase